MHVRRRPFFVILAAAALAAAAAVVVMVADDGDSREPYGARSRASGPAPVSRAAPKPEGIRDCASRVEGGRLRLRPRDDVVAGPIVFYGLRDQNRVAVRDPSEAFRSIDREYKPLKTVTEVRADTVVTVAVAPEDRGRATLFYVRFPAGRRALGFRLDEGQAVVRFESCPEGKRRYSGRGVVGPRTQFNGGFLFTEPQCLRLDVYDQTRGTERRYVVPYGRARSVCRG